MPLFNAHQNSIRRNAFTFLPFTSSTFPLFLFLLAKSSLQDPSTSSSTVPCIGGSSFQIDPARPNNVIVAGLSAGPGGNRYQMVNMDLLSRNVCSPATPSDSVAKVFPRLLITRCDECSKCPQELPNLHRALSQVASDTKIASLLVILGKDLDRLRPNPRQIDNSLVKFVYSTDDDPGLLTFCDPPDAGDSESLKSFSKTSVLFVSISFIILIVISLAWLVFYYVQRFRYAHAKDRLQRRLFNAAKKALARIPTRPVKAGDKELNSDCPVCIDPYKPGDICRQLPCRHIFHKSCVDPWLLDHRTCPMCKSDILKAFGYHVSGRRRAQFSANVEEDGPTGDHDFHREGDRMSIESTGSESANPFPIVTEVHDPFGFAPSISPQIVQMVNQGTFQIIPMAAAGQNPPQNPHCEIIQAPIERHSIVVEADELVGAPLAPSELPNEQREGGEDGNGANAKANSEHSGNGQKMPSSGTSGISAEQQQPQPKQQQQSTGLRLFRAVTGRRFVNANFVQISRSRSFSQSQISPTNKIGTTSSEIDVGDDGAITKAIIYSVNGEDGLIRGAKESAAAAAAEEKLAKSPAAAENANADALPSNQSRSVTAPSGGFRRKVGSSQTTKRAKESGQRAETRVDMMSSGTL